MIGATSIETIQFLRLELETVIRAPLDIAFESLLEELGPENEIPGGQAMPMVLEAWPGGRWFRDLGNETGHLWGHVQVIKPPTLLEISGPLFMSYPCANHIQYRLTAEGLSTRLKFAHRAFGEIDPEHRKGVGEGWNYWLERVRQTAETKAGGK
jgi:hypothetical protein